MVLATVAVTGASGMLGRHVVAALRAAGIAVIQIGRGTADDATWRPWELTEWRQESELDALFASVDVIVHAGAAVPHAGAPVDDGRLFDANVRATANLADWARRRGRPLVHVSGAIVYEDLRHDGIREGAPLGWNGLGGQYGFTKLLAEDVLRREAGAGLCVAILRPTSIYGHGLRPEKLVASFAATARRNGAITVREPVMESTNLIHAADVAAAVVAVLRCEAWETFNLAAENNTTMLELAEACCEAASAGTIAVEASPTPPPPPTHRFRLDTARARTRLGWTPQVPLARGIRAILDDTLLVVS